MNNAWVERKRDIDLVKSLAIFGVIVIHIFAGYIFPEGSSQWYQSLFWGTIVRASVPLFLMCTGALLLEPEKQLSVKHIYTRYFPKVIVTMVIWAFVYQLHDVILSGSFGWRDLAKGVLHALNFQHPYHFYYLYVLILFYAFLPLFKHFVQTAEKSLLEYALLVWLIVGTIVPFLGYFYPFSAVDYPRNWDPGRWYTLIGYPVLGCYLQKFPLSRKRSVLLFLLGFTLTYTATWIKTSIDNTSFFGFLDGSFPGVSIMGVGIFCLCHHVKQPERFSCITKFLSGSTLCVYLVHMMFIDFLGQNNIVVTLMSPILSIPLLSLLVFAMSLVVYVILKHIPGVRKWLI